MKDRENSPSKNSFKILNAKLYAEINKKLMRLYKIGKNSLLFYLIPFL